jgi:septum site-determining protein MinC
MEEKLAKEASDARTPSGKLEREEGQSVQGSIAIKGTRNGLLLTLEPGTAFGDLLSALSERLSEAPTFFRGASLTVDTSQRNLRVSERIQLEHLLAHYQMSVTSMDMGAELPQDMPKDIKKTVTLAETPVIPVMPASVLKDVASAAQDVRESYDTLFLHRTVRSGQAIRHASNVVVLGDVNPGAEIVAGGDILVWGVLRGMVHAGYPDNEHALVCSLLLSPVQLRIGHLLSRPPEGFEAQPRPEVAMIKDGQIVVETWLNGRPPRK